MQKGLKYKLLALLLGPILLISILVAFVAYFQIRSTLEPVIFNLSQEVANRGADVVDQWLIGLLREVRAQAERKITRSMQWDAIKEDFMDRLRERPDFEMFFLAILMERLPTCTGKARERMS